MTRATESAVLSSRRAAAIVALFVLGASCVDGGTAEDPGARVAIGVAPLSLAGISDATYDLELINLAQQTVWTRSVSSRDFGDGRGDIAFVGPCDAQSSPNTLRLTIASLVADGVELVDGVDYRSPSHDGPLTRSVPCLPNADAAVAFDLTIARPAQQGFFDIAITFDDIFCSAKLDCLSDGAALELLHDPETGARGLTAVLAFACTAGAGADTWLHMNNVEITCSAAPTTPIVVPVGGPTGNQNPPFPAAAGGGPNDTDLLFQSAVYRGTELLGGFNKAYWQVALGLNEDAFPNVETCRLVGAATASNGPLSNGLTPLGETTPYVAWDVELVAGGTRRCTAHPLDASEGDVATVYVKSGQEQFGESYRRADGTVVSHAACDCDDGNPCTEDTCVSGICGHVAGNEGYTEPCYEGPPATAGVGACHSGAKTCAAGVLSGCQGQVVPQPEACGGGDADCDHLVDDVPLPYAKSGCTDVAFTGTASASSSYSSPAVAPAFVLDHCGGGQKVWNSGNFGGWWQVTLPSSQLIDGLSLLPNVFPNPSNVDWTVKVRNAPGDPFTSVFHYVGPLSGAPLTVPVVYHWVFATPVTANEIRIEATAPPNGTWFELWEVSVFSCP